MISVHYMAAYITYPIRLKAEQFQSKQLSHAMSRYNDIIRVAYIVGTIVKYRFLYIMVCLHDHCHL